MPSPCIPTLIGGLLRKAERRHEDRLVATTPAMAEAATLFVGLSRALIAARAEGADLAAAVDRSIGWVRLEAAAEQAERLAEPLVADPLAAARTRHASVRLWAPSFLDAFTFRSYRSNDRLLQAIGLVREGRGDDRRKPPERPTTSFLRHRWRRLVIRADGSVDRRLYEVAVLVHLRERLRAGDVWVEGGRRYRPFDEFLMARDGFDAVRREGRLGLAVTDDLARYLAERRELLHGRLSTVAARARRGDLPDVVIAGRELKVAPIRRGVPDAAEPLRQRLYAALPRVKIAEVLVDVDAWTGFTERFLHLRAGLPARDKAALLAAILADGTNLGLTRMAESSRGVSHAGLLSTAEWHVRDETYAAALARIIDVHRHEPLAALWGMGETSSSDGQYFRAGGRGEARAEVNARYGHEPGVLFYTHLSDQYGPFHTKVIAATAGEAPHVIDGLLQHQSSLRIREHYTDTAGGTDAVFGLCHLLGFRFAPRLRDLHGRRLYTVDKPGLYPGLEGLVAGPVRLHAIAENWDELLRLAASIGGGIVPASVALKKLAAYPRQNSLARALREVGRIERTLFILRWLEEPALRRRSHGGLNKGEGKHALDRAVFFNRLGELRDRTFEDQRYRASGLTLVTAAIILWNSRYLARAVTAFRREGIDVPDRLLTHVAPLGWGHIALTGDYAWDEARAPRDGLRPLRPVRPSFRTAAA